MRNKAGDKKHEDSMRIKYIREQLENEYEHLSGGIDDIATCLLPGITSRVNKLHAHALKLDEQFKRDASSDMLLSRIHLEIYRPTGDILSSLNELAEVIVYVRTHADVCMELLENITRFTEPIINK